MAERIINLSVTNHSSRSAHTVFGAARYKPAGICGPRVQKDYQLVLMHQGGATVTVQDTDYELSPGFVALMHPGKTEMFRFNLTGPTIHSWCAIAPTIVPADLLGVLRETPPLLPLSNQLTRLVELGLNTPYEATKSHDRFLDTLGLASLCEYSRFASSQKIKILPSAIEKAQAFVRQNFATEVDRARLAAASGVSGPYLSKLFREHFGTTPVKYVWDYRLERSADLLRETGLSVSEISYQTGFQNPFHFSRLFRQKYRISPRDFRKRSWSGVAAKFTD
jgi:AraC-like DNA-binding protein